MEKQKYRDLTLISLSEDKTMVIACDSCGGIGLKENDVFKVPPFYVGKLTARVGILEVMCSGAEIVTIVDAVCNEMEDTGSEILRGIKEELKEANIEDVILTGSTEENFPTSSTALGVTVIGIIDKKDLRIKKAEKGSIIVCIGIPKVGEEINLDFDKDIISYTTIKELLALEGVYEIIPVGSKGILYEAEEISRYYNLKLVKENKINVDITKSAGTATCAIALVNQRVIEKVKLLENVNVIGVLE